MPRVALGELTTLSQTLTTGSLSRTPLMQNKIQNNRKNILKMYFFGYTWPKLIQRITQGDHSPDTLKFPDNVRHYCSC